MEGGEVVAGGRMGRGRAEIQTKKKNRDKGGKLEFWSRK